MKRYRKGDIVTFAANRRTYFLGEVYHKGETITIRLIRSWDPVGDMHQGGPWGEPGFKSSLLRKLSGGRVVTHIRDGYLIERSAV